MVGVDNLIGHLIKTSEVLPQIFIRALKNVEEADGDHFSMPSCCKLVD